MLVAIILILIEFLLNFYSEQSMVIAKVLR